MQIRPLFARSVVLFALNPAVRFATAQDSAQRNPTSVAIVELFTSEGCSSCPPADALLRQIHLKQTSAGQLIVGISEHVTYWNDLGSVLIAGYYPEGRASTPRASLPRVPTPPRWS